MAISKKQKENLVEQYIDWIERSEALFLTEYAGLTMKELDDLRQKARQTGGEFHVVKNTLGKLAFEKFGIPIQDEQLVGTTAIAFAFEDPAAMAKSISDFESNSDSLKIKSGYLERNLLDANDIKALAELPPMPVIQSQILGALLAPASKLARLLNEPARQITTVLKAYAETENSPVEA